MSDYRGNEPIEEFGGGNGSSINTAFVIATPGQLRKLIIESRRNSFKGKHFRLATDFKILADTWEPIGATLIHSFNGTFNGDGHAIKGVLENNGREKLFGLFGYLKDATITNLQMEAIIHNIADNTVYCYTGSIAGYSNHSTITECSNKGRVETSMTGSIYTGGIVGISYNHSTISNCINTGEVNGESTQNAYVGGIAGDNTTSSVISDCTNQGVVCGVSSTLEVNYEIYAGGISGRNSQSSDLIQCTNHAPISGNGKDTFSYVGGIAGQSTHYCNSRDCLNLETTIGGCGRVIYIGGIIGNNDTGSTIDHCSNRAIITGQGSFCVYNGGITGFNLGSEVYDCCQNSGLVNGKEPTPENNYLRTGGTINVIIPCPNGHDN